MSLDLVQETLLIAKNCKRRRASIISAMRMPRMCLVASMSFFCWDLGVLMPLQGGCFLSDLRYMKITGHCSLFSIQWHICCAKLPRIVPSCALLQSSRS